MSPGELMFRGQCMNCHTGDGYRSMRRLMNGRKSIGNMPTVVSCRLWPGPARKSTLRGGYLDALVNSSHAPVALHAAAAR